MPDYSKGQIYVIRNDVDDLFYVGSTCVGLSKRMELHKAECKQDNMKIHLHMNELGFSHFRIELVEDVADCQSNDQLKRREGHFQRLMKPQLNIRVERRTKQEYHQDNKERIRARMKVYHAKNREQALEYNKEPTRCETCDITLTRNGMCAHLKSKKHAENVKNGTPLPKKQGKIYCDVCDCHIDQRKHLERHNKSQKHLDNVKRLSDSESFSSAD